MIMKWKWESYFDTVHLVSAPLTSLGEIHFAIPSVWRYDEHQL